MNYRREIDGLRAIAVLPVILFHAGFQTFSGGFVGVDVFFVISGYLITSIILAEKQAGTFTLISFYERRARRILPALFVVMAACLPFAWLWLLPHDMKSFTTSLAAVVFFISNIFFKKQSGYFDSAADLKPLLHTWSLAVEEQYYLFFPLFLIITWHLGKRWIVALLTAISIVSLGLAHWGSIADPTATFYLLPTRSWELLMGALIAFYFFTKRKIQPPNLISELWSFIGLLSLTYSVFIFDNKTPFPSLYTLAPTIGTALIILFASSTTLVGRLLGTNFFVSIGLISYSAYLWHQPMLAFARHAYQGESTQVLLAVLAAASFVFAYFSWRYIETPLRDKKLFSRKYIFSISLIGVISFFAISLAGHFTNGFISRIPENQQRLIFYEDSKYKESLFKNIYRMGICLLEPEQNSHAFGKACQAIKSEDSVLIWGDSHAAALSYGLGKLFPNITQYNSSGCPPIKDAVVDWRPNCKEANEFVFNKLFELSPTKIFLHANWTLYKEQNPILNISKTIKSIRTILPKAEIFVIGPVPQWNPSLPVLLIQRHSGLDKEKIIETPSFESLFSFDKLLKEESLRNNVIYLSPLDVLCSNGSCLATVMYKDEISPIAWDYGHLTEGGSVVVATKLLSKKVSN